MTALQIEVYGIPRPAGSKRAFPTKDGRVIVTDTNKSVPLWRDQVMKAALDAKGNRPMMTGPIVAHAMFWLPRPLGHPKTKRTYPSKKPDLSKLIRSTEDSLVDAGVIADDALIISWHLSKEYAVPATLPFYDSLMDREQPGVTIRLRELE